MHEEEFFTVCTAHDGGHVAMCESSLGGAGLISTLILLGRIRELAFTTGIYMSDPDGPTSSHNLFPQHMAFKKGVLICLNSLASGRPKSQQR